MQSGWWFQHGDNSGIARGTYRIDAASKRTSSGSGQAGGTANRGSNRASRQSLDRDSDAADGCKRCSGRRRVAV